MGIPTDGPAQRGPVGLGVAALGNLYSARPDDVWPGIVPAAWEAGIRYFDVAPHYGLGLAEERLGEGLRGLPRDEYVVSTKVGRIWSRTRSTGRATPTSRTSSTSPRRGAAASTTPATACCGRWRTR